MNNIELIEGLKKYFLSRADSLHISLAFLYGSYASGFVREDSDIDVAVMFCADMGDDRAFENATTISLELTGLFGTNTETLVLDHDFTKPMLYYNAIIQGIPVYMEDFTLYCDMRIKAITHMEDFSIFGLKWQAEVTKKRLERLLNG